MFVARSAILALALAGGQDEKTSPPDACRDSLTIEWVHPFRAALEAAEEQGRLLLIKPIAFGTSKDGGW